MEVVYSAEPSLASSVLASVGRYRLPCMPPGMRPIDAMQLFRFQYSDEIRHFKDMTLATFVGAIDGLASENVRFDLSTMGCPFDLRFTMYRPYFKNRVLEIGSVEPARREFLDWMRRQRLRLNHDQFKHLLGDSMTISVPCGVLDLQQPNPPPSGALS